MKAQQTIDVWQCDWTHENGTKCAETAQKEFPRCAVCAKHSCHLHRQIITATLTRPHLEPSTENRQSISVINRTKVYICYKCRDAMSDALEKYWPEALNMLLEECVGYCREKKESDGD